MKTIEELRSEFEAMCYERKWNICRYPDRYKDVAGLYVDDFVNGAWFMFQELKK